MKTRTATQMFTCTAVFLVVKFCTCMLAIGDLKLDPKHLSFMLLRGNKTGQILANTDQNVLW